MANKIKKMKLKTNNNTFKDVLIGADAENIDLYFNEESVNLQDYVNELEKKLNETTSTTIEWNKDLALTE